MTGPMYIAGRPVGPDAAPYIVAELSGNHNGDPDRALDIIRAVARSGADAVKIQTYTAETITIDHDGPEFTVNTGGLWDGRSLYDLYDEAHTPWEWHKAMFDCAADAGVAIFSAPFDHSAVDFLETLDCPAYKIASFEIVDLPLITKTAATGKPLIISTGMASIGEIREAVETARAAGASDIALLHCVSGYPTPASDCHLATIPHLADELDVQVGLSDHTLGTAVPVATEDQFQRLQAMTCVMGDLYARQKTAQDWLVTNGVDATAASAYVGGVFHTMTHDARRAGPVEEGRALYSGFIW